MVKIMHIFFKFIHLFLRHFFNIYENLSYFYQFHPYIFQLLLGFLSLNLVKIMHMEILLLYFI